MISPEVWNFKSPRHHFHTEKIDYKKLNTPAIVTTHYFNHSVSLIIPDANNTPKDLENCILEDSDYYHIKNFRVCELLEKTFIERFIKCGELTLLAIGNKIDLCNSIAVTPTGLLVISLITEDFQKLGLEGSKSFFDRKIDTRHVVTINLKDKDLIPGKKKYEHIRASLKRFFNETFDIILSWEPPIGDKLICPSSVAKWFDTRGYNVLFCCQRSSKRTEYSLNIPILTDNTCMERFFEWLGLFSISGNIKNEEQEYVSTYKCPKPCMSIAQMHYFQCTGFFTKYKMEELFNKMKVYASLKNSLPWCALHVQGFTDSPVSWDLQEHTFFIDGDNSYTIIFRPNTENIIRKSLSSNNKPKLFL